MYLLVSANPQLSFAQAVGHRVATVTMYKYDNRFLYEVSSVFLHKDIKRLNCICACNSAPIL